MTKHMWAEVLSPTLHLLPMDCLVALVGEDVFSECMSRKKASHYPVPSLNSGIWRQVEDWSSQILPTVCTLVDTQGAMFKKNRWSRNRKPFQL